MKPNLLYAITALLGLGVPILSYPGSGGSGASFTGGTVSGATTFSDDVTFSGGTGALGFGSGETIVPADSTLNVTGTIAASVGLTTATVSVGTSGGRVFATTGTLELVTTTGDPTIKDNSLNTLATFYDLGTTGGISVGSYRGVINSSLSSAASDLTAAQFRASHVFPVDTSSNAVDVEISEALDALDVGMSKIFRVATGHATNALTVTADASGVTTATLIQQGAGASCEDARDFFRVTVTGTQAMVVESYCAD